MRAMLVALSLVGCGDPRVRTPDARPPIRTPLDLHAGEDCGTYTIELCDGGAGTCVASICRTQCSAVSYPRCPFGLVEQHVVDSSGDICVCAPRG